MNQQQLNKLDDFYKKSSQHNLQAPEPEFLPTNSKLIEQLRGTPLHDNYQHQTSSVGFKALEEEKHKRFRSEVKTKWDSFQPYAFHRLSDTQKDEHFLQLFDDYLSIKIKLNEQSQRYKKLYSRNVFLQQQVSRAKSKSPQRQGQKHKRGNEEMKQNQHLKQQVKRLHEKIHALTGNKHKINAINRPKSSAKPQKAIFPANENIKAQLQLERKQVRQLLIIIDELKATKFSMEAQLKEKQYRQNPSKVHHRTPLDKNQNQSQFQSYAFDLQKWKEKYNDLELCFNKMSEDKDKRIRQLQIDNINLKQNQRVKHSSFGMQKLNSINTSHLQDRISDLEREKESLEREVRRMVALPFNQTGGNKSQIELQEKNSKLELALQKLNGEFSKVREERGKYLAELEFKSREVNVFKHDNEKLKKQVKELLHKQTNVNSGTEIDYNDYYRKLLGIVKLQGDDPVWRKYSVLASPSFSSMTQAQLKKQAQQLWLSKLQLLAHLQKAQIQLRTSSQTTQGRIGLYLRDKQQMQQQLRIARARLDQWASMDRVGRTNQRQVRLFQDNGVRYDDSVSVFDGEQAEIQGLGQEENYFDLYLGGITIDEQGLLRNPNNKIKQLAKLVSFLTVDFYTHDTQHSTFLQGPSRNLNNNFSFKVQMNNYTIKYLAKQSVMLQLWSPQGASTVLLGKGEIWLRQLVEKAGKEYSCVLRGKCPVYSAGGQRVLVATVQYRVRMRLPIGAYCQWNPNDNKLNSTKPTDIFRLSQRRRLSIKIPSALSLPSSSSHFVHFTLQGDNFNTSPERGSSPQWNYQKQIQLIMDEQLQQDFKQKYLQFVIFDDQQQVNEDVVGIAKADLTRLLELRQEPMKMELDIKDQQYQVRGKLKVEFKWL